MEPLHVLIVDDHEAVRRGLRSLLSFQNVSICGEAADGVEAIEKAKTLQPDVVIMDVSMPQMDGIAAARIIRREVPNAKVVIVSQNDPNVIRGQAVDAGARAFVTKADLVRDLIPVLEGLNGTRLGEAKPAVSEVDSRKKKGLFDNGAMDNTHLFETKQNAGTEARANGGDFQASEQRFCEIIDALPTAIYTTDPEGNLTHFNPAAVEFAGRIPELGKDKWCINAKILLPDETPLPLDQCPMAIALKEGRIVASGEYMAERPDGTRVWFSPYPRLLRDAENNVIGGINMLLDITDRKRIEAAKGLLAAIVDSSDDAIVSKNLDSIITSWNHGAERLFGYTASEAVGRSIMMIIPSDRRHEEAMIISRLRRGERIDHFETVRMRKDGTPVEISLAISPVKDSHGRVIGASKVARDITERRRIARALAAGGAQQRALFHLADQLHRARSSEDVYSAALDAIIDGLQCDRASILLYDSSGIMRFVSSRGLSDNYRKGAEGHSPWQRDERSPQPVCVEDVATADFEPSLAALVKSEGIAALSFTPLMAHGKLIGKFMAYFNSPHNFADDERELSLAISRQLAFGIERQHAEEELRRSEDRFRKLAETLDLEVRVRTRELEKRNIDIVRQSELLRDLSRRLLRSQDDERRHIARELHDSAGQTLTVLGMTLARVLQEVRQNAPQLAKETEQSQRLLQQLNKEIRTMSYLLHPPLLDESGLAAALSWYVQGLTERSDLDIKLIILEDFGRLPRDLELVIFRLVQECLTNIHRHSGSKSAEIMLTRDAECIALEVQDHGKGISPERLNEIQLKGSGVGIRGMRERVSQFNGYMNIGSNESGTRITFTFPVPEVASTDEESNQSLQAAG